VKMAGDAGIVSLMEVLGVETEDFSVFASSINMDLIGNQKTDSFDGAFVKHQRSTR